VYVTASGQLGVLASSERYKTHIADMGRSSRNLKNLRPVTFELKTDAQRSTQYGLIAEEVAKVYPDLVVRNDKGRIEGVRYEELAPMYSTRCRSSSERSLRRPRNFARLRTRWRSFHAIEINHPMKSVHLDLPWTSSLLSEIWHQKIPGKRRNWKGRDSNPRPRHYERSARQEKQIESGD
jgi:hypothetical protein